jgi:hypothetical protein
LLRHVPFGDTWQKAAGDAPWRRHTGLTVDARGTYQRVRMDHWLYDVHSHRLGGWMVFLLLAGAGGASLVVFVRRTRDRESAMNGGRERDHFRL